MTKLAALLFDLDGTLVDTEELHRQAFNQAFLEFGLGWDWGPDLYAELLAVSGGPGRLGHYTDRLDLPAGEKTRLRPIVPALHRQKTRIYGELLAAAAPRLRPGIARLVEEARRAGCRIGIVASSASANAQSLVASAFGRTGGAIGAVIGADAVARRKPAPDLYELLLASLGVSAASSVAFEDSANGVAAAKAAGLYTVATPTRWTRGQDFTAADLQLPSLGEPDAPLETAVAERLGGARYLDVTRLEALLAVRRSAAQSETQAPNPVRSAKAADLVS